MLSENASRARQERPNLLSNALRHPPADGRVTLRAQAVAGGVALTVADTGTGIPPDVLPHIFERAVRADAARTGRGAGLGLSIVRSLVGAMGGTVDATSQVGAGTRITVILPVAEGASGGTLRGPTTVLLTRSAD